MMRSVGYEAHTGEMRNTYKSLIKVPEDKKLLRGPRCRYEDNIKMDILVIICRGCGLDHLSDYSFLKDCSMQ
jgi:hypothetical protein